jgi:hypothetical protein
MVIWAANGFSCRKKKGEARWRAENTRELSSVEIRPPDPQITMPKLLHSSKMNI